MVTEDLSAESVTQVEEEKASNEKVDSCQEEAGSNTSD